MAILTFEGTDYRREPGETVLDCLIRHGVAVPHACKSGVCQSCVMRALHGDPPVDLQRGLKDELRRQRYFLSCVCRPEGDFAATLSQPEPIRVPARVLSVDKLSERIARVRLDPAGALEFRAGQFLDLWRDDGLARSYSIASVPPREDFIELHVARLERGRMSNWIHEALCDGDEIALGEPRGECCYNPGKPEQPLLLLGTGSGLAPLYGIVRDALHHGHTGAIRLYHGSRDREGLYLVDELRALAREHGNFEYHPCLSGLARNDAEFTAGRALDVALAGLPDMKGWRVYACGHPDMVNAARRKAFLAGAALTDILADPFSLATR